VPFAQINRMWTGPGIAHPDMAALQVGLHILGGLQSSRLDNAMVRGEELAVSVLGMVEAHEDLSFLTAQVTVSDGVDRAVAEAALDREIARLLADGPSADELARAQTQLIARTIGSLESVGDFGGKGELLAEGLLYAGHADHYRTMLEQIAALTPAQVQDALQRWLSRPALTLTVVPGERILDGAQMGGWGDEAGTPAPPVPAQAMIAATRADPPIANTPRAAPPIAPVGALAFPQVERATLSSGIPVLLARRTGVPQVSLALTIAAGSAVDAPGAVGVHETMVDLLLEGTTTRTAEDIAAAQERLGTSLSASAGIDQDTIELTTLSNNLAASVALMADTVLHPAFRDEDVERVRERRIGEVAEELTDPAGLAQRVFLTAVYGAGHPYARAATAGDAAVIAATDPARLEAEHRAWFRPDLARITAVGNVTMPQLLAALESEFGNWRGGPIAGAAPVQPPAPPSAPFSAQPPIPRLLVIDRPNSPSSYLMLGRITPLIGYAPGMETIGLANEVLGSGFLSRLMSDLREAKSWTYGIGSGLSGVTGQRAFAVETQVQADRTADSIRAIIAQLAAFPGTRPVDEVELQRVTTGNIRSLPGRFETNAQVLDALLANQLLGREDRYHARLPEIYRAVDAAAINAAARDYLQPDGLTIVVVGDRSVIEGQLSTLGMAAEYVNPEDL